MLLERWYNGDTIALSEGQIENIIDSLDIDIDSTTESEELTKMVGNPQSYDGYDEVPDGISNSETIVVKVKVDKIYAKYFTNKTDEILNAVKETTAIESEEGADVVGSAEFSIKDTTKIKRKSKLTR